MRHQRRKSEGSALSHTDKLEDDFFYLLTFTSTNDVDPVPDFSAYNLRLLVWTLLFPSWQNFFWITFSQGHLQPDFMLEVNLVN